MIYSIEPQYFILLEMETKTENTTNVVANIIRIRNDKRIGQAEMAEKLGISVPSYSRIESQSVSLTYETLAKIASVFSMRVIDIITYPEIYSSNEKNSSTRVIIELDVTQDEFIKMGLKDKVIQVLNK